MHAAISERKSRATARALILPYAMACVWQTDGTTGHCAYPKADDFAFGSDEWQAALGICKSWPLGTAFSNMTDAEKEANRADMKAYYGCTQRNFVQRLPGVVVSLSLYDYDTNMIGVDGFGGKVDVAGFEDYVSVEFPQPFVDETAGGLRVMLAQQSSPDRRPMTALLRSARLA